MAVGRSRTASKPVRKRVSKKVDATSGARRSAAGKAANRKRTIVLDGTFSIEEIEVTGKSRRKAKKTAKKKVSKKVRKKAAKKVIASKKRTSKPKTGRKAVAAEPGTAVLARQPCIKTIAELKDALTTARSAATPVVVDARHVDSIDTAALQLLVAFANSLRDAKQTLVWQEPSDAFREMADLADLTRHLDIGDGTTAEDDDGLCPVF